MPRDQTRQLQPAMVRHCRHWKQRPPLMVLLACRRLSLLHLRAQILAAVSLLTVGAQQHLGTHARSRSIRGARRLNSSSTAGSITPITGAASSDGSSSSSIWGRRI